jgi:MFS family permease
VITWIQVGLFFRVLFYVLVGLMPNSMGILAVSAILLLTGPVIPYTKTVLSNTVPPHSQAQAFSAISAIESLAGLSGPVFDAALVGLLKVNQAWVIFEVAALITLIAFFMIYHIRTSPTLAQNLPQDSKVDESSSSWIGNRSRSRSASRSMSASLAAGGLLCFEAVYENGDSDCESEGLVEENGLQPLLHGSQGDNVT